MGDYWGELEIERMRRAMLLLGWRADSRFTSEDEAMITPHLEKALALESCEKLTPDLVDELSNEVFRVIAFQIMNVEERARIISAAYSQSRYLCSLISLVDEGMCCYYRTYVTAALATLFIVIESCLRNIYGWQPGDRDLTFADLRDAVLSLPPTPARDEAHAIARVIYQRYKAEAPPQFYFNRHGLLHGLRGPLPRWDAMNCVRLCLLMDLLCAADGLDTRGYIFQGANDSFHQRLEHFKECLD